MSLANSWKNYFAALPDEDERHRQLADIRGILRHGLSPDEAAAAVENDPNSAEWFQFYVRRICTISGF